MDRWGELPHPTLIYWSAQYGEAKAYPMQDMLFVVQAVDQFITEQLLLLSGFLRQR